MIKKHEILMKIHQKMKKSSKIMKNHQKTAKNHQNFDAHDAAKVSKCQVFSEESSKNGQKPLKNGQK